MSNVTDFSRDPAAGGSARSTPRVPSSPGEAAPAKAAAPEPQREDQKMNAIAKPATKRLHPDAKLLRLGRIADRLDAMMDASSLSEPPAPFDTPEHARWNEEQKTLSDKRWIVQQWIASMPARTIEGMMVKAKIARSFVDCFTELTDLEAGEACTVSLFLDLEQLTAPRAA